MTKESIICDNCGKIKGEANRWWKMLVTRDPEKGEEIFGYAVTTSEAKFDNSPKELIDLKDFCSDNCLAKTESQLRSKMLGEVHASKNTND